MADAETYTPGLIVSERRTLRRERRLPVRGEVRVDEGQAVSGDAVVARADLPGRAQVVNVAGRLGVSPDELRRCLLKKEGDPVEAGEPLAQGPGFFGLFKSTCTSPAAGRVESISGVTGQVVIREHASPVEITAYLDGWVAEVFPGEGVQVETEGAFVQGIFGVGGERRGELAVRVDSPEDLLQPDGVDESCRGRVVVAGRGLSEGCVERVGSLGVQGLVVGSIRDRQLRAFLGYDLGGAITGSEAVGTTLIVTEGFGDVPMAARTFGVLSACEGMRASINGRTQVRAGVIRPEVIVAQPGLERAESPPARRAGPLTVGARVRGTREPFFGRTGVVSALPPEPVELETEASVRVVEVELDGGRRVLIPRSNVEAV